MASVEAQVRGKANLKAPVNMLISISIEENNNRLNEAKQAGNQGAIKAISLANSKLQALRNSINYHVRSEGGVSNAEKTVKAIQTALAIRIGEVKPISTFKRSYLLDEPCLKDIQSRTN